MKYSLKRWGILQVKTFDVSELKGCKKVYAFTLKGLIFNKSNVISAVILLLISLLSPIVMSFFSDDMLSGIGENSFYSLTEEDGIEKVYVKNQTEFDFDLTPYTGGATVSVYEKDAEEFRKNESGVLYHVYFDAESYRYKITAVFSENFDGSREAAGELAYTVSGLFDSARYEKAGLTEEKTETVFTPVSVNVSNEGDYFETENDRGFMTKFAVQYLFAIVVLILVAYSATYIIRAVLEEKASKLVETLMVSVRPLALITGKILAAMTYIFGLLLSLVGCIALSSAISSSITGSKVSLEGIGLDLSGIRFDAPTLILVIIALILSYLTYSIMSGIAGAACGSMEELESANGSVMFTVLIGYLVSCFTCSVPSKTLAVITSLCPIISTFSAPAHYILGNISLGILLLSFLLQAVVTVLLAIFCSRVYAELIMRKGSRLKFKEIFKIYFIGKTKKHSK